MKITIYTIAHQQQRYDTVGDWIFRAMEREHELTIYVSKLGDWRMEALVAIHELIEALGCRESGITTEQVDEFDKNWPDGLADEPGDDPKAPYFLQHQFATSIEKQAAEFFQVDWEEYAKRCEKLVWPKPVPLSRFCAYCGELQPGGGGIRHKIGCGRPKS